MYYPTLTGKTPQTVFTDVFGGYNHNERIGDGEFYDMKNLTADKFPMLSVRKKMAQYRRFDEDTTVRGIIAKKKLCYVKGSSFVIAEDFDVSNLLGQNDTVIDMGLNDSNKTLVSMGAYVVIMPDKKYINTENTEDRGNINNVYESGTTNIGFAMTKKDGSDLLLDRGDEPPDNPNENDYWLDTSNEAVVLKQYRQISENWITVSETFVKISVDGIGAGFSAGDTVEIMGVPEVLNAEHINGYHEITFVSEDSIVIKSAPFNEAGTFEGNIKVSRGMPDVDFLIESNNRLWGCKYGKNANGETINEIYASKLGDFKNWHTFEGISTDSYSATVGSDGAFTGAISYLGYPLFFKENCLHKVYGNFPSNFSIQTTECRGVQSGSSKSLAIVNEILFYKSRNSICAYDGSFPSEISQNLGNVYYKNAIAGASDNKYYISMQTADYVDYLFTYDVSKGLWHKLDNTRALDFAYYDGQLLYVNSSGTAIMNTSDKGNTTAVAVEWYAQTAKIGISYPNKRYLKQIKVKIALSGASKLKVLVNYDNEDTWEKVYETQEKTARSFIIPIKPRRCDHFSIKLEGAGDATIYSITRVYVEGSDK